MVRTGSLSRVLSVWPSRPQEKVLAMRDPVVPVAIFNASDDTVDMLQELLKTNGFATINGHVSDVKRGAVDILSLIRDHRPQVILWDISPPYDKNWTFLKLLRS